MVLCGENHQPIFIEVKITRWNCWHVSFARPRKFGDALPADAYFVFQFRRNPRKQLLRNRGACAPTRAFVSVCAAKLTTIRLFAKRAQFRIELHPVGLLVHQVSPF